jgi:hypothetical protein
VRTLTRLITLSAATIAAVGLGACGRSPTRADAGTSDLQQQLKLAASNVSLAPSASANLKIAADEELPASKPEHTPTLKKSAGPKAVRSHAPTVRATPSTEVAAAESDAPQAEAEAPAPAPTTVEQPVPEPSVPAVPRPSPVPAQTPGGSAGQQDGGSAVGAILGGIFGAVIRGGTVDGDHCDPRGGRRGHGGVYYPNTGRGYPGGVYGGGRNIPINPLVNPRGR